MNKPAVPIPARRARHYKNLGFPTEIIEAVPLHHLIY